MSTQPKALWLADALENWPDIRVDLKASAAELRRLHTENEAKDALLRQALEALDTLKIALRVGMPEYGAEDQDELLETAITALRAALAESERDWSLLGATQQSLREHMAEIQRLRQALEFTAQHKSSDWPERCQQMVDTARAALAEQEPVGATQPSPP